MCVSCDPLSLPLCKIVMRREINVPRFCYYVVALVHIESSQPHLVSTGVFRLSSLHPTPTPTAFHLPLLAVPLLVSRPPRLPQLFPRTPYRRLTPHSPAPSPPAPHPHPSPTPPPLPSLAPHRIPSSHPPHPCPRKASQHTPTHVRDMTPKH